MHLSIYVAQLGRPELVIDGRVQISGRATGEGQQRVGPMTAIGSLTPNWYGVDLPIREAGEWVFTLAVEGTPGQGVVDFTVTVREGGGID